MPASLLEQDRLYILVIWIECSILMLALVMPRIHVCELTPLGVLGNATATFPGEEVSLQ